MSNEELIKLIDNLTYYKEIDKLKVILKDIASSINLGIKSTIVGEPNGSDVITNIVSLTQAEYDAGNPLSTTLYIITDA